MEDVRALCRFVWNADRLIWRPQRGAVQEVAEVQDRVTIEILDNGVGLQAEPATRGTGIGLRSVRERMRAHFGDLALLQIEARDVGGVCARISFSVPVCHPELRPTPEPRAYAQVA